MEWTVELGQLIHDFARIQSIFIDQWMQPLGITRAQGFILVHLMFHPGATPSELAEMLEISRAASGGLIKRLIERGMVEALTDPKDLRVMRLVLTARGREVVTRFSEDGKHINRWVYGEIDEAGGQALIELFKRMKERFASVEAVQRRKAETHVATPPKKLRPHRRASKTD